MPQGVCPSDHLAPGTNAGMHGLYSGMPLGGGASRLARHLFSKGAELESQADVLRVRGRGVNLAVIALLGV